jgi:hypothetical protein
VLSGTRLSMPKWRCQAAQGWGPGSLAYRAIARRSRTPGWASEIGGWCELCLPINVKRSLLDWSELLAGEMSALPSLARSAGRMEPPIRALPPIPAGVAVAFGRCQQQICLHLRTQCDGTAGACAARRSEVAQGDRRLEIASGWRRRRSTIPTAGRATIDAPPRTCCRRAHRAAARCGLRATG